MFTSSSTQHHVGEEGAGPSQGCQSRSPTLASGDLDLLAQHAERFFGQQQVSGVVVDQQEAQGPGHANPLTQRGRRGGVISHSMTRRVLLQLSHFFPQLGVSRLLHAPKPATAPDDGGGTGAVLAATTGGGKTDRPTCLLSPNAPGSLIISMLDGCRLVSYGPSTLPGMAPPVLFAEVFTQALRLAEELNDPAAQARLHELQRQVLTISAQGQARVLEEVAALTRQLRYRQAIDPRR